MTAAALLRSAGICLHANFLFAAISALVAGALGWACNCLLLIFVYEGFRKVPVGAPATGDGNMVIGSLIWFFGSALLFGVVGYWRSVGGRQLARDARRIPAAFAALIRADGPLALSHLLWGSAAALLFASLISPWLALVLSVSFIATGSSVVATHLLWGLCRSLNRPSVALLGGWGLVSARPIQVCMLGASIAGAFGLFLVHETPLLWLSGLCALAAFILGGRQRAPRRMAIVGWLTACSLFVACGAARADDGGWIEAGRSWSGLVGNEGLAPLMRAAIFGGAAAALGAILGVFIGGARPFQGLVTVAATATNAWQTSGPGPAELVDPLMQASIVRPIPGSEVWSLPAGTPVEGIEYVTEHLPACRPLTKPELGIRLGQEMMDVAGAVAEAADADSTGNKRSEGIPSAEEARQNTAECDDVLNVLRDLNRRYGDGAPTYLDRPRSHGDE